MIFFLISPPHPPRDLLKFNVWTSQRRLKYNFQVSHCTNLKDSSRLKFGKTKICQEQNILTFVYNKTGADSSEWFEPAEDANLQGAGRRHRKTASSKPQKTQPHRLVKTNKPSQAGPSTVQQKPKPKPKKTTGVVYIINMRACLSQPAPPFGKVGSSSRPDNNCEARVRELQTGNPHQLVCNHMFPVTEQLSAAERGCY